MQYKNLSLTLLTSLALSSPAFAQSKNPPEHHQFPLHHQGKTVRKVALDYAGFIRWDGLYNTRQSVGVREGLLYFFPKAVKNNAQGVDENATSHINFLSVFTRGALKVSAPSVWGADVSGLIEADFFGHLNSTISNFRLRHAYFKLQWSQAELMFGQYWDSFTNVKFFPGVLNPGAGQPLQPFSRNPGIYFNWQPVPLFRMETALTMQRDAFAEFGAQNELQQNSGLPGVNLNLVLDGEMAQIGVGAMGKAIRPNLTSANLMSGGLQVFANSQIIEPLRIRARAVYGSNLADHQMLGGFVETDDGRFLNLNSWSSWLDIEYKLHRQWKLGLFGGYTGNLGTQGETGTGKTFTARFPDQAYSMFIAPRLIFEPTKALKFALETHWTQSMYATKFSNTIAPEIQAGDQAVNNLHVALIAMLKF